MTMDPEQWRAAVEVRESTPSMTRTQGVIVCLFLLFISAHLVMADIVGIRILMEANHGGSDTSTSVITDSQSPSCDPEGDVCP